MNFLKTTSLLLGAVILAACNTDYRVSEEKINRETNKKIAEYQSKKPLNFSYKQSNVSIHINDMNIDLQAAGGGYVAFRPDVDVTADISILGKKLSKTVKAQPMFVSKITYADGEFFLDNPEFIRDSLKANNPIEIKLLGSLAKLTSYIKQIPIYKLDHNIKEKVGAEIIDKMRISDTEIIFEI